MKKIICSALLSLALLFSMTSVATAASLGLTTQSPTLGSSSGIVDYVEFGGDGILLSFGSEIDSSSGVSPVGFTNLAFDASFPLLTPTSGATGFFDIFDDVGQFLGGDLFAVGFTEDIIELQFDNLIGSAASSFGSSALALVTFVDPLGTNPFDSFVDGDSYVASVSISNVVTVSEPKILVLLIIGLFSMLFYCRNRVVNKRVLRAAAC